MYSNPKKLVFSFSIIVQVFHLDTSGENWMENKIKVNRAENYYFGFMLKYSKHSKEVYIYIKIT